MEELCGIGLLPINLPKVELANSLERRNSKSVFASDLNFVIFAMNFFQKVFLGERDCSSDFVGRFKMSLLVHDLITFPNTHRRHARLHATIEIIS